MKVRTCPLFDKKLKEISKTGLLKPIIKNLIEFIKTKQTDSQQAFGKKDKLSPGGTAHKNVISNLKHTPLHKDRNLYYKTEDSLDLYGIFTHSESGTDGNVRTQKQFVDKLKNQDDKFSEPDILKKFLSS